MPRCHPCSRHWRPACFSPVSVRPRYSSSTSCSGARGSTDSNGSDRAVCWASRCRSSCSRFLASRWHSSCGRRGWAPTSTRSAMIGCAAGLILAASVNSMPTRIFNSTLIYDVILVVVLGGIGLSGGRGGVLNVVIGTLLIGTMLNGMTIMDVSYSAQNLIKGVVLLVAVIADSFLNPRNEETAQQGDI